MSAPTFPPRARRLAEAAVVGTTVGQKVLAKVAANVGAVAAQQLLLKVAGKGRPRAARAGSGQLAAEPGGKLAAKVRARVGGKMTAKGLLGFAPLPGSLASAGINASFLISIGQAAWDCHSAA